MPTGYEFTLHDLLGDYLADQDNISSLGISFSSGVKSGEFQREEVKWIFPVKHYKKAGTLKPFIYPKVFKR